MKCFIFLLLLFFLCIDTVSAERIVRRLGVRSYVAHIPESDKPLPVILVFHPYLGSSQQMENSTQLQNESDKFITAYPDGGFNSWNLEFCCWGAQENNVDDVAFVKSIFDDLRSITKIEPKAHLVGWSNGSLFAFYLMCSEPQLVASVTGFGAVFDMSSCPLTTPIPVFYIHGVEDVQAPIVGGGEIGSQRSPSAADAMELLASRYSSNQQKISFDPLLDSQCISYLGGIADVRYCPIERLGHSWPGTAGFERFGPPRPELQGSRSVMSFIELTSGVTPRRPQNLKPRLLLE